MKFDLILKKKRVSVLYWETAYLLSNKEEFGITWNNAPRHTTPSGQTATSVDERAKVCVVACALVPASFSFWWRRIGSYHSQDVVGGHREPSSATCGTAAVMQLSRSRAYALFLCSVFVMVGRSSRPKNWACGRHDFLVGATADLRRAMVCGRGRGCCFGRVSLRFAFYRLDRGRRHSQESPQTPLGVLTHHEHATSRLMNSQNSKLKIKKITRKKPRKTFHSNCFFSLPWESLLGGWFTLWPVRCKLNEKK